VVNLVCITGAGAAAVLLTIGSWGGVAGLVGLAVGLLLLDIAVQCNQVANQARIFTQVPGARSRLNSAYMTCVFLGGNIGSGIGVRIYPHLGWLGVCALVAATALAAFLRHMLRRHRCPRFSRDVPGVGRGIVADTHQSSR
jgi:predicted MFS family arabinose efflux permease